MKCILLGIIFGAVVYFTLIARQKSDNIQSKQSDNTISGFTGATTHDFGTVAIMDPVDLEHTFSLTNASDATITLMKISTTCGCTSAEADRKIVNSGETVNITASLLLSDSGSKQAQVVLLTDAGEGETLRLTLSAVGQRQRKLYSNVTHVSLSDDKAKKLNIYVIDYTTDETPEIPTMEYPEGMNVAFQEWEKISERRESDGLPARWEGEIEIAYEQSADPATNKRREITINLPGYQSLLFTATITPGK